MGGGYLLASAASVSYGSATVLQARGVGRLGRIAAAPSLAARLRAGYLYAVGLMLDGAGFLMSVVALRTLPVFLVQALVCSSVGVTAALAVPVLGITLRRQESIALLVTCAGLALLVISAREGAATPLPRGVAWLLLCAALPIAGVAVAAVQVSRRDVRAVGYAAASGLGFGVVAIAARSLDLSHVDWHLLADPLVWAIVANGAIGAVAYACALSVGRITVVAAATFTVETVLPSVVGVLALGDRVRPSYGVLALVGLVSTLFGSVILARAGGVGAPEPERVAVRSDPGEM